MRLTASFQKPLIKKTDHIPLKHTKTLSYIFQQPSRIKLLVKHCELQGCWSLTDVKPLS